MGQTPGTFVFADQKFDGVVKSPIYCVAVFLQRLGILHVLLSPNVWEPDFSAARRFILQRLRGDGMAFVHAGGTVIKKW